SGNRFLKHCSMPVESWRLQGESHVLSHNGVCSDHQPSPGRSAWYGDNPCDSCAPSEDMTTYKPRVISLTKNPGQTFGFYLRVERNEEGHLIRCLEMGGPAELAGMKDGDRILRVNGTFVDGLPHSEVSWPSETQQCINQIDNDSMTDFLFFSDISVSLGQVVELVRNGGASVAFHILDESSYKQAKALGVNLSDPQSTPVTNGVAKEASKPKLCYLVKSSSGYGFSLRSVKETPGMQGLPDLEI
ncbi:hypothetical protein XENOCAPTIV_007253, partial [Xenoophorus captivus]